MPFGLDRRGAAPDYIGIGAEACGGEWWHSLLLEHPAVRGPHDAGPALHFFDAFCDREMTDEDVSGYHRRFPARRGRGVAGEWTPRYLADGWTPPLLRRAAPDARLLVMLRDPVQRFREALATRLAAHVEGGRLVMTDVADRAGHASQLRRLRRYVDPERVLVLQFERCAADPAGEYRRTLEFLGVDASVAPPAAAAEPPPTGPQAALWPELEQALLVSLEPDVRELAGTVAGFDATCWPGFAHLADDEGAAAPART